MKKSFLPFLFIVLVSGLGHSQCSNKAGKLFTKAKQEQVINMDESISLLYKAIDLCPNDEKIVFLLADLEMQKGNVEKVESILSSFVKVNKHVNPKAYYFLGVAQQKLFMFEKAIPNFQAYLDSEATSRTLRLKAAKNLADSRFAKSSYENPPQIDFTSITPNVNTSASEYLPIMTADETTMVFTRRETVSEQAYFTEKREDSSWTAPVTLSGLPPQFRKAAVSISIDGNMIVFAMADHPRGQGNFDLYFLEKKNGRWSQPQNFGNLVNTPGWESQPCISSDGRTVFFSTDRKGGEGGHDIWKTKRERDGSWSKPTNLGIEINGPGNEESPFIHRDQRTLYFRSTSHPGLGSFDIFMSRMIRFKKWTEPLNLGYPYNTIGNDGSMFVSLDGKQAYIASDVDHLKLDDFKSQPKMRHIDIYQFELAEEHRPIPTTYVKINFVDAITQEAIQPWIKLLDYRSADTLFFGYSDANGELLICLPMNSEYSLSVLSKEYVPHFERFEPMRKSWSENPVLKTVALNKTPKTQDEIVSTPVILQNVLFKSNEADLEPESFLELNNLFRYLEENEKLNIVIRGHTDDVGDDASNQNLSLRRAKAVYDYLIDKGISQERLSHEGLGEASPIADNGTEEGRRINRRTEFLIVE